MTAGDIRPGARGGRAARRAYKLEQEADFQKARGVLSIPESRGELAWAEAKNCPICRQRVHPTNWSDHMTMKHPDQTVPLHEAEPGRLPLIAIRIDGGTQSRTQINPDVVADYAEAMREGKEFPAIDVWYDGEAYWVSDGFHRIQAAKDAGLTDIKAEVHQGTLRDAILASVGANDTHGLRRTNFDKQRAVNRLLDDSEWATWSNREIARKCAVSESLVRSLRDKRSDDDQIRTYTTKHGTQATMNTGNIGKPESNGAPASLVEQLGGIGATVQARSGQTGILKSIVGRIAQVENANGVKDYDALYLRRVDAPAAQNDEAAELDSEDTLYPVMPSDDEHVERARQIALGAIGDSRSDVEWRIKGHGHSFNHDFTVQWGGQLMFILAGKNHSDAKTFARNQVAITLLIDGYERLFRFSALKLLEWKLANQPAKVDPPIPAATPSYADLPERQVEFLLDLANGRPVNKNAATRMALRGHALITLEDDWSAIKLTDAGELWLGVRDLLPKSYNYKRDSKATRPADETKSQPFDSCQTPAYALDPLLPYLEGQFTIWEPAAGEGLLVEALYDSELSANPIGVIASDILTGQNFFEYEPELAWDCIVTNPPFSLKFDWLKRCYQLGKPFALLLPVETLGTKTAQDMFREYGIEIILMDKRVNFKMPNKGWDGAGAQFPVAWFTWGLNIGSQITYARLESNDDPE